jgi:hypothetical protein
MARNGCRGDGLAFAWMQQKTREVAMTDTIKFLKSQIESAEQWKNDHDRAMQCANLQDLIKLGITVHGIIRGVDDLWSRKVQSRAANFDPAIVNSLRAAYEWWIAPCAQIFSWISKFEEEGFKVDGATELRNAYSDVRGILRTDTPEIIAGFAKISDAA